MRDHEQQILIEIISLSHSLDPIIVALFLFVTVRYPLWGEYFPRVRNWLERSKPLEPTFAAKLESEAAMRFFTPLLVAAVVFAFGPVFAQGWVEYSNTEEGFFVNLPNEPQANTIAYMTQSGALVSARVFTSTDGVNRYSMTVVNLASSPIDDDETKAMTYEISALRQRGQIRSEEVTTMDGVFGRQISVLQPDGRRVLIQLYYYNHRLYIAEGNTTPDSFGAGLFQTSVMLIHPDGRRVNLTREREAAQGKAPQ